MISSRIIRYAWFLISIQKYSTVDFSLNAIPSSVSFCSLYGTIFTYWKCQFEKINKYYTDISYHKVLF